MTVTGAPVSVSLLDAGGLVTTVPVSGNGTYAFSIPAPPDGSYTYRANAADLAGNTGADFGAVTVQVDRSAPATAPTLVGPASPTHDPELVFTATLPGDASAIALWDGTTLVTVVSGSGTFAFAIPVPADGDHSYEARARDAVGNDGDPTAPFTVTVDRVAPAAPTITAPSNGAAFAPGSVHVTGTAEPGATVTVTVGTGAPVTGVADGSGSFDVPVAVPEGTQPVSVTVTDPAGNVSAATEVTVTARTTTGDPGGGGCGCGNAGAAPGLLALLSVLAFAPRRRRLA